MSLDAIPSTSSSVQHRPDLAWIKQNIPIEDVARELGLDVVRHRARCWRADNHANGDANPSLYFHRRKNRVRCFVCDQLGGHSNIDLLMGVLACDFASAVAWICDHFLVPQAKRGSPIGPRSRWLPNWRVGTTGSEFELLVRSGFWSELTPTQRAILPVLAAFRDTETGLTTISYLGLMRYSGVRSSASIAKAISGFQRLHVLNVRPNHLVGVVRGCNSYQLTLEDPDLLRLMNERRRVHRDEIEREREFRKRARTSREKQLRLQGTTAKPAGSCKGIHLSLSSEVRGNKTLHCTEVRGVEVEADDNEAQEVGSHDREL